jgi:hypothetical protein
MSRAERRPMVERMNPVLPVSSYGQKLVTA